MQAQQALSNRQILLNQSALKPQVRIKIETKGMLGDFRKGALLLTYLSWQNSGPTNPYSSMFVQYVKIYLHNVW